MLKSVKLNEFNAIAHLNTTALVVNNKEIQFSTEKPNVILGANGTGKSTLLRALSIRFMAHYLPKSTFQDRYVSDHDSDDWWVENGDWLNREYIFMKGLECDTDNAPVMFYRPGHIPGNEVGITHAMMCGYHSQARAYAELVTKFSSGQANQNLLHTILEVLRGEQKLNTFDYVNWQYGKGLSDPEKARDLWSYHGKVMHKAEQLKKLFQEGLEGVPLILMDEPEQSLDAKAELNLWKSIEGAHAHGVQVVVASHSLYPILYPEKFHIIEATPGYLDEAQSLMK